MNETFGAAFGRLVKAKRAEHKLTQGQLAERVWPNDSNAAETRKADISKLENGKTANPHTNTVKRIADVLGITAEEIDTLHRQAQMSPQEQLDAVPTLSRNQLELLASRFELERAFDKSDAELRGFLENKAEEYRTYKAEIDAIDERTKGLGNLKAAAQDAAKNLNFEEVETLLSRVQEVELEVAAETAELRANNALLRNRSEQAYAILSAAADSFAAVDPLEPARRRLRYEDLLYQQGLRYGGNGIALSVQMIEAAVAELDENESSTLWALAQNSLAVALQQQGTRTAGSKGAALLGQAVESYRAGLRVRTEADHPVYWAVTMQNLGIALKEQGTRTAGPEGAALLREAVESYRAALRVRTEADHPVQWAMTQENMAILEEALAEHDTCTDRRPHLEAGLVHVEAALTVYDPEHMLYYFEKAAKLRDLFRARLAALDNGAT